MFTVFNTIHSCKEWLETTIPVSLYNIKSKFEKNNFAGNIDLLQPRQFNKYTKMLNIFSFNIEQHGDFVHVKTNSSSLILF